MMDWASRAVLAWRLSNTMDAGFCVEALQEALGRFGKPAIFNTFVCLATHDAEASSMDSPKRQTSTATPAEPGELPWILDKPARSMGRSDSSRTITTSRRLSHRFVILIGHEAARALARLRRS